MSVQNDRLDEFRDKGMLLKQTYRDAKLGCDESDVSVSVHRYVLNRTRSTKLENIPTVDYERLFRFARL